MAIMLSILSFVKQYNRGIKIISWLIIIIVSLLILAFPFWPSVSYYVANNKINSPAGLLSLLAVQDNTAFFPIANQLIIPKINVRIPIVEGGDESVLNKGAWHLPGSSTPDRGGNTVLTAHRFKYLPPNEQTFYLLDKLTIGDTFQIIWQNKAYYYQVKSSLIVTPDNLEVIKETAIPTVTLITCHPLFSTKERLVVVGELIN